MESNNSSSNTATACSSDPPPPNQRNDDRGKQTCSNESEANNNPYSSALKEGYKRRFLQYDGVTSNESEVNENKNNNPESSDHKAGKKRKSSSSYGGFLNIEDNDDLKFPPDGFFEEGTPWNNDQCYSDEPLIMEQSVSGNDVPLDNIKGLDPTEDVPMSFFDDKEGPPQPSGGSPPEQLYHDYHPTEAENQTVANSEGLFGYGEPKMEHLESGNDSEDLASMEDVDKYLADEDPSSPQLYHDHHPF